MMFQWIGREFTFSVCLTNINPQRILVLRIKISVVQIQDGGRSRDDRAGGWLVAHSSRYQISLNTSVTIHSEEGPTLEMSVYVGG